MQNGLQTLDSTRKTLKSWRTLKKASLNRGFSLKNLDLVKVFLLTKNFTKSGLYCTCKSSNLNIKANYFRTLYTDCIFFYLHFTDCNIFVLALHFCNIFESSVSVYLLEIFETRLISTQTGSSSESVYLLEIFKTKLISIHC